MAASSAAAAPAAAAAAAAAAPPPKASATVTLLTFNDVYQFGPEPASGLGGLAECAAAARRERAAAVAAAGGDDSAALLAVNGDFLVVSSLANRYRGAHMVAVLNAMGADLVVAGNHEFDYGPAEVVKRVAESEFTWVGSNMVEPGRETVEDTAAAADSTATPSAWPVMEGMEFVHVREMAGFKVGFFGICTADTASLSFPEDTVFRPVADTARVCVKLLRESLGCDVVVALTHQGMEEDRRLARGVSGIDVILGGHDHQPFSELEGTTLIHKSGQNGTHLGRIRLFLDRKGHDASVRCALEWSLIAVREMAPDPETHRVIQTYSDQLEELKHRTVATVAKGVTLSSRTQDTRAREATFANLLADCVREHFGGPDKVDLVALQGGSVRGDRLYYPETAITEFDLATEFPFPNICRLSRVTGKVLRGAVEQGAAVLPLRAGCFLQWSSGVRVVIDPRQPVGKRLESMTVHGKEVADDDSFNFVCLDFILKGGDGFTALGDALRTGDGLKPLEHEHDGDLLSEVALLHLKRLGTLQSAGVEGRIVIRH